MGVDRMFWATAGFRFAPLLAGLFATVVFAETLGPVAALAAAGLVSALIAMAANPLRAHLVVRHTLNGDLPRAVAALHRVPTYAPRDHYLPIGENALGLPFGLDLRQGHVLIGGITGFGKSSLVRILVAAAIESSMVDELALIDLKRGVELSEFTHCSKVRSFGIDLEDSIEILSALRRQAEGRLDDMRRRGQRDWVTTHDGGYLVVVIDEVSELLQDKEGVRVLDWLVNRGRAAGFVFILATQQPTTDVIPSRIRQGCPTRIAFRCAGIDQTKAIFGTPPEEARFDPGGLRRGNCVVYTKAKYIRVRLSFV